MYKLEARTLRFKKQEARKGAPAAHFSGCFADTFLTSYLLALTSDHSERQEKQ